MMALLSALCVAITFFGGGRYATGHEIEGLAEAALAAGWLGIIYSAALRSKRHAND